MSYLKHFGAIALLIVGALCGALCHADTVTQWNSAALDAIRLRNTPPPMAARNLAMLHVAIYDAVNGIQRTHERYIAKGRVSVAASPAAAATSAARDVLVVLYPEDQPRFDALHARLLQRLGEGPRQQAGMMWGASVAAQVVAARANDGSGTTAPWPGFEEPGKWRPTISFGAAVRPALLPLWGQVIPFALNNGTQFRPPAPPALSSMRYAFELEQVRRLGALDSLARTVEQTQIAQFWGYGPGSATPSGHWNQIAQSVAAQQGNSLADNARLFALLNMAMADAGIVSWDCKYSFNYWRPITAIQLADTDGNRHTRPDPAWMPLLETPPFPEYSSGHSTFSGAAAAVLAAFYRKDRIAFSVGSDDLPGVVRFYTGFSHAAWESGVSRIYGGIHFMSANLHGLHTGAQTGRYVMRHYLRPLERGADGCRSESGRCRSLTGN